MVKSERDEYFLLDDGSYRMSHRSCIDSASAEDREKFVVGLVVSDKGYQAHAALRVESVAGQLPCFFCGKYGRLK